jgi:hypothetical protein
MPSDIRHVSCENIPLYQVRNAPGAALTISPEAPEDLDFGS